ncbi:Integrase, catalytic core [Gossypium australe]|uniref:Integrase, catalytic core n=1 Tax=Gossypium australe TaxID=47621 RepID=A0A5B6WQV7_9ROSI|nr:Integrase, catalytic core [Gossypium australe]
MNSVLQHCHSAPYRGHFGGPRTAAKSCDRCKRTGNLSRRHETSMQNILEIELFGVWGIDFMVNYVSKWIEAITLPTNNDKSILNFLHKNIFIRFGTRRAIISDEGSHFDCKLVANALQRYGVKQKIAMTYHQQTNGQAEISNREIKHILEKSLRLDEALWAYRTTYKTLLGMSPFKLVYEKPCHFLVELEHRAYWVVKQLNMDWKVAGNRRLLESNEMEEFRVQAYENAKLYKEKTKRWHDKRIMP